MGNLHYHSANQNSDYPIVNLLEKCSKFVEI